MTSQDTGGVRLPDGRAAASVCRRGAAPVTVMAYGIVWMHCTRAGCYWTRVGGTGGRWGFRAVRTTLVQWIPPLVEQVDSGRLGAGPASSHSLQAPAQAAVRGRCRRTCDGGAGLCRKDPGLTPARPCVHSADITEPAGEAPRGSLESCGFSRVCSPDSGVDVSAVDTTLVTPHPFGPLASWTTSLPRVPARAGVSEVMTLRCLRSEETTQYPQGATSSLRIRTRE